jgi:hypothetical protein
MLPAGGGGGLAIDRSFLYVTDPGAGTLWRFGKPSSDGGLLASSESSPLDTVASPAADAGPVFWLDQPKALTADAGAGSLHAFDGEPRLLAGDLADPSQLVADDRDLYWAERTTGAILSHPLSAESSAPVVVARRPSEPNVQRLAVDADHVFWITNDGNPANYDYNVVKQAKCGGAQTVLARENLLSGSATKLLSVGGYLYWSKTSNIYRMAK